MARMKKAMTQPLSMKVLMAGKRTTLKLMRRKKDFPGCYVLLKQHKPWYVGISKAVVARLTQHVKGTTHFNASLAYRMACDCNPHELRRSSAMQNARFHVAFEKAKQELRSMKVAAIEIHNPLELYLFEVFCALKLRTGKYNTFVTH